MQGYGSQGASQKENLTNWKYNHKKARPKRCWKRLCMNEINIGCGRQIPF